VTSVGLLSIRGLFRGGEENAIRSETEIFLGSPCPGNLASTNVADIEGAMETELARRSSHAGTTRGMRGDSA
jgi:hypothetical protein